MCTCSPRSLAANKPKALSAGTTAELGTKTRSEYRTVLVSAKTMPCPNKSGPFLALNGARCRQPSLVGTFATLVVTRWRILARKRHLAPNDAKQRQPTPQNANWGQAATTGDEKRQEVSRVGWFVPAVVSRSRGLRKWDVSGSRNFSRGKTDNLDMRTKWRNPICDRAAGPTRREKLNV